MIAKLVANAPLSLTNTSRLDFFNVLLHSLSYCTNDILKDELLNDLLVDKLKLFNN